MSENPTAPAFVLGRRSNQRLDIAHIDLAQMVRGAMMQFGGTTSPNSMILGVEIEACTFLGLRTEDE